MSHSLGDVEAVEPVTDPYGGGLTKEDFDRETQEARAAGFEVVFADSGTLLLDLDGPVAKARFRSTRRHQEELGFVVASRWPSKTRGHEHVVLRLSERLVQRGAHGEEFRVVTSVPEGLLLEACFGSDPRRALLAYRRWLNGVEEPSRLFKPTRPTTHERKEE